MTSTPEPETRRGGHLRTASGPIPVLLRVVVSIVRWRSKRIGGLAAGVALLVIHVAIVALGWRFLGQAGPRTYRHMLPTGLLVSAGAIYLLTVWRLCRRNSPRTTLIWVIIVAAGMRLTAVLSPPIADADYWRYLWDGAVTAHGISPYRYSPREVIEGRAASKELHALAAPGRDVLGRITHPHLRTIYPPFAQGLFAVAYRLTPFRILGWRVLLLVFDACCATIVLLLLQRCGLPRVLAVVYLWNPLLVNESYCGGHVDLVAAALVLTFAWCVVSRRMMLGAVVLAAAVGTKLWPILLAFFLIVVPCRSRRVKLGALALFGALVALILLFYSEAMIGERSGLMAYSTSWRAYAGTFQLLSMLGRLIDWPGADRYVLAAVLVFVAFVQARTAGEGCSSLCANMGMVVLLMLLLSPTLYPWYYVALIPLATASPRPAFLVWTVLLPLTYLPRTLLPEWAVVCAIHLPVWILLVAGSIGRFRRRRSCTTT